MNDNIKIISEIISKHLYENGYYTKKNLKIKIQHQNETEEIMFNITNCLARVFNSSGRDFTRCVAINISYENTEKLQINNIHYAFKNYQKKKQFDPVFWMNKIIFYLVEKNPEKTDKFIHDRSKKIIKNLLENILELEHVKENDVKRKTLNELITNTEKNDNDFVDSIKKNFLDDDTLNLNLTQSKHIYPLMILVDFIILKDLFLRYDIQIKSDNLFLDKGVPISNVHPDSNLVFHLSTPNQNENLYKYIGASFLCCTFCSLFLDSYGYQYRGRSKKFENDWKLPDEQNINDFNKKLENIKRVYNQETSKNDKQEIDLKQILFNEQNETETEICQCCCEITSIDFDNFLAFYQKQKIFDFVVFLSQMKKIVDCKCGDNNNANSEKIKNEVIFISYIFFFICLFLFI